MNQKLSIGDLKEELNLIRKKYPTFKDADAFVFWFVYAYLVDNEEAAKSSLTGKAGGSGGEKGLDAIYIDKKMNSVI